MDDPSLFWHAWIGDVFGLKPWEMDAIYLHHYVEMHDHVTD